MAFFASPAQGQVLTSNPVRVAGTVFLGSPPLPGQTIRLTLRGADTQVREVPVSEPGICHNVSFEIRLGHNGEYTVSFEVVTPSGPAPPLLPPPPPEGAEVCNPPGEDRVYPANRDFSMAVRPVPPGGVKASFDPSAKAVTVSWARNPEPDIVGYQVERAQRGGGFFIAGSAPKDASSFRDAGAPVLGGDYRYRVVAVRAGAKKGGTVKSEPSDEVGLNVPRIGLAAFPGGRGRLALPKLPDGTFDAHLPYPDVAEWGAGDETAEEPQPIGDNERPGPAAVPYVAGGLLSLAVMLHLWWAKREAEREPLEALAPPNLPEIREPLPG